MLLTHFHGHTLHLTLLASATWLIWFPILFLQYENKNKLAFNLECSLKKCEHEMGLNTKTSENTTHRILKLVYNDFHVLWKFSLRKPFWKPNVDAVLASRGRIPVTKRDCMWSFRSASQLTCIQTEVWQTTTQMGRTKGGNMLHGYKAPCFQCCMCVWVCARLCVCASVCASVCLCRAVVFSFSLMQWHCLCAQDQTIVCDQTKACASSHTFIIKHPLMCNLAF